jgi:hypothetical protein
MLIAWREAVPLLSDCVGLIDARKKRETTDKKEREFSLFMCMANSIRSADSDKPLG